jgi:hypothetical protein
MGGFIYHWSLGFIKKRTPFVFSLCYSKLLACTRAVSSHIGCVLLSLPCSLARLAVRLLCFCLSSHSPLIRIVGLGVASPLHFPLLLVTVNDIVGTFIF